MKRYEYKLTHQKATEYATKSEVKSVSAKDASTAHWKIIEKHGASVKIAWMQEAAMQDKEIK